MLQEVMDDEAARCDESFHRDMHRDTIFFVVTNEIAKIFKVIAQVLVIVVQEEKLHAALGDEALEPGEEYLFFFDEMDVEVFADILPRFQHEGVVTCGDRGAISLALEAFDAAQKLVARMPESIVLS